MTEEPAETPPPEPPDTPTTPVLSTAIEVSSPVLRAIPVDPDLVRPPIYRPDEDPALFEEQNADIDLLLDHDRTLAKAAGARVRTIDRMRLRWLTVVTDRDPQARSHPWTVEETSRRELEFEIATASRIPFPTAARLIVQAEILVHSLPATVRGLEDGRFSWGHAQVLADQSFTIPDHARPGFEAALLPLAETLTVPQFRDAARRLREKLHPESITTRKNDAFTRRHVTIEPAEDGMGIVTAEVAAEAALAIGDRITAIAKTLTFPGDDRTLAQKKTDVFTDLLLTGDTLTTKDGTTHDVHGVHGKVLVTVPVETLMGTSDRPGNLDGYGPISPDTARRLAAHAPSFTRLLVHPVTSAILDYDRTTYTVPADLKTVLRIQDETCRMPGCREPAATSQIDHITPFGNGHGGQTRLGNLAHLCHPHHRLKTHTRITMQKLGDGIIRYTSAAGRDYYTHPTGDITLTDGHPTPPTPTQAPAPAPGTPNPTPPTPETRPGPRPTTNTEGDDPDTPDTYPF